MIRHERAVSAPVVSLDDRRAQLDARARAAAAEQQKRMHACQESAAAAMQLLTDAALAGNVGHEHSAMIASRSASAQLARAADMARACADHWEWLLNRDGGAV